MQTAQCKDDQAAMLSLRSLSHPLITVQVAWMNGLMDFVFPYLIQFLKEYTGKVDNLWKEKKERQEAAVDEESAKKQQEAQTNAYLQLMPLALPAPPGATSSHWHPSIGSKGLFLRQCQCSPSPESCLF